MITEAISDGQPRGSCPEQSLQQTDADGRHVPAVMWQLVPTPGSQVPRQLQPLAMLRLGHGLGGGTCDILWSQPPPPAQGGDQGPPRPPPHQQQQQQPQGPPAPQDDAPRPEGPPPAESISDAGSSAAELRRYSRRRSHRQRRRQRSRESRDRERDT